MQKNKQLLRSQWARRKVELINYSKLSNSSTLWRAIKKIQLLTLINFHWVCHVHSYQAKSDATKNGNFLKCANYNKHIFLPPSASRLGMYVRRARKFLDNWQLELNGGKVLSTFPTQIVWQARKFRIVRVCWEFYPLTGRESVGFQ